MEFDSGAIEQIEEECSDDYNADQQSNVEVCSLNFLATKLCTQISFTLWWQDGRVKMGWG